jgi:hypothetical protein
VVRWHYFCGDNFADCDLLEDGGEGRVEMGEEEIEVFVVGKGMG